jgi:hypothetical protein
VVVAVVAATLALVVDVPSRSLDIDRGSAASAEHRRRRASRRSGVVDWREKREWMQRLDAAIAPAPPTPPPAKPYDACDLRAVALGPPTRLGALRITSAELLADCVVIRWHLVIDEDPDRRTRCR